MPTTEADRIHVAVGVLTDKSGRVLVARRSPDAHQGGLWEFPGGKLEAGESAFAALVREFTEEVAITPLSAAPLMEIRFDYPDKRVLLDVWDISEFSGRPKGLEGQAVEWRPVSQLLESDFPAGNRAIIRRLRLPRELAITPEDFPSGQQADYLRHLAAIDVCFSLFRQKHLDLQAYREAFRQFAAKAKAVGIAPIFQLQAQFLQDSPDGLFEELTSLGCDMLHLDSTALARLGSLRFPSDFSVLASCHNEAEIRAAQHAGIDLLLLSPVQQVRRYGQVQPLGWDGLQRLAGQTELPVLALGGLQRRDLARARHVGAWGIAGISAFSAS